MFSPADLWEKGKKAEESVRRGTKEKRLISAMIGLQPEGVIFAKSDHVYVRELFTIITPSGYKPIIVLISFFFGSLLLLQLFSVPSLSE